MDKAIRAIDMFCGIGGNSWGAKKAGIEIIAGFDKWELAGKVYQANFPKARFYNVDLSTLSRADLVRIQKEIGQIDLILASPECTSHSSARGAQPKDEKSLRLSWNVWRFAEVFQPRWIVIENVPAMQNWVRYQDFLRILKKKGEYQYQETLLDASGFGVPQSRKRLYILCDREQPPRKVKESTENPCFIRQILDKNGRYTFSPLKKTGRAQKTLDRAERAIQAIGGEVPFIMVYYGSETKGGWQTLDVPLRTVTTRDRFALVRLDSNLLGQNSGDGNADCLAGAEQAGQHPGCTFFGHFSDRCSGHYH